MHLEATNAQTGFVEVAFAINTFFAQYNYLHLGIEKMVQEYEAVLATLEPSRQEDIRRLDIARDSIGNYAAQHLRVHQISVRAARLFALVAAVVCVGILYWDVLNDLGHWTGFLILPYGIYFIVSLSNYAIFRMRSATKLRRFRRLLKEFGS